MESSRVFFGEQLPSRYLCHYVGVTRRAEVLLMLFRCKYNGPQRCQMHFCVRKSSWRLRVQLLMGVAQGTGSVGPPVSVLVLARSRQRQQRMKTQHVGTPT